MKWHLMNPWGVSCRVAQAENIHHARFRLAPIPVDWFVVSDASYRAGIRILAAPVVPADAPHTCEPPSGFKARRAYNARKRREAMTPLEREAERDRRSDAARKGWQRMRTERPEAEQARREKLSRVMKRVRSRPGAYERSREASILRGIENARTRRALQLTLELGVAP